MSYVPKFTKSRIKIKWAAYPANKQIVNNANNS